MLAESRSIDHLAYGFSRRSLPPRIHGAGYEGFPAQPAQTPLSPGSSPPGLLEAVLAESLFL
eukprot:466310-Alexandrium_andersonii.AAC.1